MPSFGEKRALVLTTFVVAVVAIGVTTVLLLLLGHRVGFASRIAGIFLGVLIAVGTGEVAAAIWNLPTFETLVAEATLVAGTTVAALARPRWNPVAHVFAGAVLTGSLTYLVFGATITVAGGFSLLGALASGLLLVLEIIALTLSASFAVESLDSLCTVGRARPDPPVDPQHVPFVSLQIAAYNEPPDMLIETIRSAEEIDYPRFEIVVIDNNTKDQDTWGPVEEYCRDRERVWFVHVDPLPGYKSGALNLALREHTHPDAELIGVIDADYLIDPSYLRTVVGYFVDPNLAFLQTPQDYREFEHDAYLTACYDAYRYFFLTTMPVRNQRNSIIFAGTMGLIRRSVLEQIGGWDEWCITEDAETSLRILREGYAGLFVPRSFGRGIMPLTFAALKSQRFRWCFGGMQILRMHGRELLAGSRKNKLTFAQRIDYLFGGLQWLNDLVLLGFALVLLSIAVGLLITGRLPLRPLMGAAVLLPGVLIASGLLRALWSLRKQARIGVKRAVLAFANWLSLSWTVSLACVQGLVRREGVFLRTPKVGERASVLTALWTARSETVLAVILWSAGLSVAAAGLANTLLVILFIWMGVVYATSPFMSWLNQHTELSAQLERRRRSEWRRDRIARVAPALAVGSIGMMLAAAAIVALLVTGGTSPRSGGDLFALPEAAPGEAGLVGAILDVEPFATPSPTAATGPTPSSTVTVSPSVSATPSPTPSPTATPSPSPSPTASATPVP
jgi:cellulose synthase/poly-beta-1,6-N-acetylglucosamine synthase-like glycosyltransferase